MSTMNFLFFLQTYADTRASQAPNLTNFKWTREVDGLVANNPQSLTVTVQPSTTVTLFTGTTNKKFVYMETTALCTTTINGTEIAEVKPLVINNSTHPGILFRTYDIVSMSVTNPSSTATLQVTVFTAE